MRRREASAFEMAQRYIGVREVPGHISNPLVLAMLRLDQKWPEDDAVPWCSAFVNWIAWHWRLPRSKSLAARSWLKVGEPLPVAQAEPGFDVVVLRRGTNTPGPEVLAAPGHVGWFAGREGESHVLVLGGNQADEVSIAAFPLDRLLGIRRLG